MGTIIVISCSEDGEVYLRIYDREGYLKKLNSGERPGKFATVKDVDGEQLGSRFVGDIVIDGKIVVPKVVKKVEIYEL